MSIDPGDIDTEQVDEGAEQIEEATEDVDSSLRTYAKAYWTALLLGIVLLGVGAYFVGIIDPQIAVTAEVSIGYVVEYVVLGFGILFILFTAGMAVVIFPGTFTAGLIRGLARIADAYELPADDGTREGGGGETGGETDGETGGDSPDSPRE